ncbi:hypothetical protein CN918_30480 [Priestia megaterium]|nr:hypothetical protein CN918_30480 [Priestia megaterium]
MKTIIVGASATIISGALTGFNGLVVGYDSIDNEVSIKLDNNTQAIVPSEFIEQTTANC